MRFEFKAVCKIPKGSGKVTFNQISLTAFEEKVSILRGTINRFREVSDCSV